MSGATCPQCGTLLNPSGVDSTGMLTCSCGFRVYAGYVSERNYLDQRQEWLDQLIQQGSGAPDPATAQQYGIWAVQPAAPETAPQPPGQGIRAQVLLLILGAGLLIIAGIVFVAVTWDRLGAFGQVGVMALITALAIGSAVALRERVHRTAEALAVVGFAMAVIDAAAAPALGLVPEDFAKMSHPYPLVVSAVLFLGGVTFGRRLHLQAWTWLGWATTPVLAATLVGQFTRATESGQLVATFTGVLFVALALGLILYGRGQSGADRPAALAAATFSTAVAAISAVIQLPDRPPWGSLTVIAAAIAALAIIARVTRDRAWLIVAIPLAAVELTLLILLLPTTDARLIASVVVGAVFLFTVARINVILALLSTAVLWVSLLLLSLPSLDEFSWWCVAVGAVLLIFALVGHATAVVWVVAVLWQVALTIQLQPVEYVEEFTLPLAALLLGAGLLQRRAAPTGSAVVYGPALSVALIPTALMTWSDQWSSPSLIRFLVVIAAGVGLLILGIRRDLLGVVVPASIAVAIAATAQIWATLEILPRWLALAIAGTALIVVAARIEWARQQRDKAEEWVKQLH